MSRGRAFLSLLLAVILLPLALGWLAYSHRTVSVSCQRASGNVNCSEAERIADQSVWTQPLWTATAQDAYLTTRAVDDESNPTAVIIRTHNDTDQVQFTSGMLGTNEAKVEDELHQFLVVRKTDTTLQFELAPALTWRDLALPLAPVVLVLGLILYSLFRVIAPSQARRTKLPRSNS